MLPSMRTVIQLLLGLVSCCVFIALARRLGGKRELRIYAVGLFVAAMIYLGFVMSDVTLPWLALELGGVVLFTLLSVMGLKASTLLLALGWALHAIWDIGLHKLLDVAFVPDWYPVACAGFDLLLAGYIAVRFKGDRERQEAQGW